MSKIIDLNLSQVGELDLPLQKADTILTRIKNRDIEGQELLGWQNLPAQSEATLDTIKAIAHRLRTSCSHIVCIGIGGSYIGARAVIESLSNPFAQLNGTPPLLYAGHHLDTDYLHNLLAFLEGKTFGIIYISKSGTTTEPAIAFRFLKQLLEKNRGYKEAAQRIVAITDAQKGSLIEMARREGYSTLFIPQDVGGRFSVLSPVGLLPIATAGYDIEAILGGAQAIQQDLNTSSSAESNVAALYACARNALYLREKKVELMVTQTPLLLSFMEWWKQLFGESEGKDEKGLLPHSALFTTDLHSLGQWIQQGDPVLFETILSIRSGARELLIPKEEEDTDQLNYLAGRSLAWINQKAIEGTIMAHSQRGVPVIELSIDTLDEYNLGALIYFFQTAVTISGCLLELNPFDQPGVEEYKKNMFALLGKPKC